MGGLTPMDARFSLDGKGQLAPQNAEAKRLISGFEGTYQWAPTTPDLLCLVRRPVVGGQIQKPRVVLAGDAGAFPLTDLLAFLGHGRWSGMLVVHGPRGERAVTLKDGEVRGAASENPNEQLADAIIHLGYAKKEQVEEVLEFHPASRVGRVLVEKGLLQPHDLWKCLTQQVTEIFHAIVLAHEGVFLLVDQELDDKLGYSVQLPTQSLLMDALRRVDEMAHFRKRIPNSQLYVVKKRGADGKLEPLEDRLLAHVTGRTTIAELGKRAKLSQFDVTKLVFRLLEGGYVALSDAPAPNAPVPETKTHPASPHEAERVVGVFNQVFREIRDEVAKKGVDAQLLSAVNQALDRNALSSSPVLTQLSFEPSGTLSERALLARFDEVRTQLGSEPVAALKQALSDVMFFLLFQAGELLESQGDDLARRVKQMLATIEVD